MAAVAVAAASLPGSVSFRAESMWYDQAYAEKRQMFLRSYQFCKKKTAAERLRLSLLQLRRALRLRVRAVRRVRRLVWSRLRQHLHRGRRTFHRLSHTNGYNYHGGSRQFDAARAWFGTPCHW